MVAVRLGLIFSVLLFFNSVAYAKSFAANLCDIDHYVCYTIQKGDSWEKLFPDETARDAVMRINRTNMRLYKGQTIAIPNAIANYMSYSPFPLQIDPPGKKFILVSLNDLAFGAYNADGTLAHWGPVSGGRGYCPDVGRGCHTPSGKFFIFSKGGRGCSSSKFPIGRGGAPMPYCMYFKTGYALHGSPKVPGYNDSHGCVRLFTIDAQWLNQDFTSGESGVTVIIKR